MQDKLTIEVRRGLLGTKYRQDDELLKVKSMYKVIENYPECKEDIINAKTYSVVGKIFSIIGSGVTCYAIASGLAQDKNIFSVVYWIGMGALGNGIYFTGHSAYCLGTAVRKYNNIIIGSTNAFSLGFNEGSVLRLCYFF
ncbi:MAG: hypothetical protein ABIA63_15175 [bacterium]